jgi:Spy/CpxP family protein refolding chaperone
MDTKLKTILTPEQLAKWNTIKEERKDKMKEKRKEGKE